MAKEHTKILPCPKCGSKADWWDYCGDGWISCTNKECRHHGDIHKLYNTYTWESYDSFKVIENAILEWNADR